MYPIQLLSTALLLHSFWFNPGSAYSDFSRRAASHENNPEQWYTKYANYPPYCSLPTDMSQRRIPPISADDSKIIGSNSRLLHVTAIIRHGARTPYSPSLTCWDGYASSSDSVWNCDLTTLIAPPSPRQVQKEESEKPDGNTSQSEAMFIFEKHYDALLYPQYKLSNAFHGTCQLGQLLLQGYEQELTNGKHLREAYVYDSTDQSVGQTDPRMQLINVHVASDNTAGMQAWDTTNLKFRVDDDQRTIMSGQVLLRGMLEQEINAYLDHNKVYPIVPLHTADRYRDILSPNVNQCPRLQEISESFYQSQEYNDYNTSAEAELLRTFQQTKLGLPYANMDAVDCLMTTICTDRSLPLVLDDYKGEPRQRKLQTELDSSVINSESVPGPTGASDPDPTGRHRSDTTLASDSMFYRLFAHDVEGYAMLQTANDAEYAKLGTSFLWAEIMENIYNVLNGTVATSKLALFSGHDTTIMPLLASLGPRVFDRKWSPYASLLTIEIHKLGDDRDKTVFPDEAVFRLIYNGNVITSLLEKCSSKSSFCDAQVLVEQTVSFSRRDLSCARKSGLQSSSVSNTSSDSLMGSKNGLAGLVLLVICSMLFGSLATYFYISSSASEHLTRRRHERVRTDDGNDLGLSTSYSDSTEDHEESKATGTVIS
jgi:hypothetical protein